MAARLPSIADTVDQILREASVDAPDSYRGLDRSVSKLAETNPFKKLAVALRELPDPELTYPVLHVVKNAMMAGDIPIPSTPETKTVSGANWGLRKLASAMRDSDHADSVKLLAKGAHTIKATRGLMLLRDLVRE